MMIRVPGRLRFLLVIVAVMLLTSACPVWADGVLHVPLDLSGGAPTTPIETAQAGDGGAAAPITAQQAVAMPPASPVVYVAATPPCPPGAEARGSVFAVYLWATGVKADLRAGPLEGSIDASFSDILDNLDFAFAGYYEMRRAQRGFYLDLMYVRLSDKETLPVTTVDFRVQQTLAELGLVFLSGTAQRGLDGIIGARYMSFRNELSFSPQGLSGARSEAWVDPIIGGRYRTTFSPQWTGSLRVDVGGFGVGSDFSWQILALASYHWTAQHSLVLGYRYLDVDYDASSFAFDGAMSGPVVGVAWAM